MYPLLNSLLTSKLTCIVTIEWLCYEGKLPDFQGQNIEIERTVNNGREATGQRSCSG